MMKTKTNVLVAATVALMSFTPLARGASTQMPEKPPIVQVEVAQSPAIQFEKVTAGTTTVFISKADANCPTSMDILQQNGLRPLTYPEALGLLYRSPQLIEILNAKWFYLNGEHPTESGLYSFDDHGTLSNRKGKSDKTVLIFSRVFENSLALQVFPKVGGLFFKARFMVSTALLPDENNAPMIIGVKIDQSHGQSETEGHCH
jgi:hypothetical protein